ncbi:aaa family atpase [Pyrenophora seminiperda CCB06]|uniref:Aaa family atpase n=1 Tax=Pyrenophora seminiperda CCB06 TaxID=1302712 RepID=A0A3M7LYX9_9PLEO|nr:aaa family atpase [Pyrenophora seminiperda CCB06]
MPKASCGANKVVQRRHLRTSRGEEGSRRESVLGGIVFRRGCVQVCGVSDRSSCGVERGGQGVSFLSRQQSVKQLYDGKFLHRVLEQIVEPPSFWNILVEAHSARILTTDGTHAFAWLPLEILRSA